NSVPRELLQRRYLALVRPPTPTLPRKGGGRFILILPRKGGGRFRNQPETQAARDGGDRRQHEQWVKSVVLILQPDAVDAGGFHRAPIRKEFPRLFKPGREDDPNLHSGLGAEDDHGAQG